MRTAHSVPRPPGRSEVKNKVLPSGDQRGLALSKFGDVTRRADPPVNDWIQTSLCRLFSASFTVVSVKATVLPSGERVAPASRVTRYQSESSNARPCALAASGAASSRIGSERQCLAICFCELRELVQP